MGSTSQRGFSLLGKGKFDSGIKKFENALFETGQDPAGVIELLDTNEEYCKCLAEFAARGAISMPTSYNLARRIMGVNFFGLEEWGLLGVTFTKSQIRKVVSKFPWSEEFLDSPCPFVKGRAVRETHFAFLGADKYNGVVTEAHGPLTIMNWQKIFPADSQPRFYLYGNDCWHPNEQFAAAPLELRWYLGLKEIVPDSASTSWAGMQGMIPEGYEVPSPIVETTKVLLHYKKTGVYLNRNYYAATNSLDSHGIQVLVGYCDGRTVNVYRWLGSASDDVGLSLVRKF